MASLAGSLDDMGHEKYRLSPVGKSSQEVLLSPRKGIRQIARTPFKVLDAPELTVGLNQLRSTCANNQDDFYLNLVSWSASNVLGVGLNSCVYLWSAQTSRVTKLCDTSATTTGGEEVLDAVTGLEWTNKVSGSLQALTSC
jgi:cell division cycle 20-like protein 1 (cofactor of APC complex)